MLGSYTPFPNVFPAARATDMPNPDERLVWTIGTEYTQQFIADLPTAIAFLDSDMHYLAFSRRWLEDYRLDGREILGKSHYEIFPEIPGHWRDVHRRALNGEAAANHEERFVRQDGTVQWLSWLVRAWHDTDGRIGGIVIQSEDISARKEAELALKSEREVFMQLAAISSDYFWELDPQFRYRSISPTIAPRSGLDYLSYLGKTRWELPFIGISEQQWVAHRSALTAHQPFRNLEGGLVNVHGELRHFLMSGDPTFSPDGKFTGYRGVTQDITDRKKSEETLRKIAGELDDLYHNAPLGYHSLDSNDTLVRINDRELSWLGYAREEVIGKKKWSDLVIAEQVDRFQHRHDEYRRRRDLPSTPYTVVRKNGTTFPVLLSESPNYDAEGKYRSSRGMVVDNTERALADALLQESEARYRALFENMNSGFVLFEVVQDPQGDPIDLRILAANRFFELTTGVRVTDAVGKYLTDAVPGIEQDDANWIGTYAQVAITGEPRRFEAKSRVLGTTYAIAAFQPVPRQCAVTFHDISELKAAQDKLSESYGKLQNSMQQTLLAISKMVEARDAYTAGHARRVGLIAGAIARAMGWTYEACYGLELIGLVHDIGKISTPAELLSKPDRLTEFEYAIVKAHPHAGYEILKDVDFPLPIAEIIYQHHERMNGTGYPRNLQGDQILIEARIVAVADVVEAIYSDRPYRPGKGLDAALAEIERNRGVLYDEKVVDTLLDMVRTQGYQFPR